MSLSKPYPKYYKLVLNSAQARYYNNEFCFDVSLPLFDNINTRVGWVMCVNSFNSSVIPSNGLNVANTQTSPSSFANIHLKEFSQITSYSSKTRTNTSVIATFNGRSFTSNASINSVAIPIDEYWWCQKSLTVFFSDENLNILSVPADATFQISILIWKADD